jgi:hypothetical protein
LANPDLDASEAKNILNEIEIDLKHVRGADEFKNDISALLQGLYRTPVKTSLLSCVKVPAVERS